MLDEVIPASDDDEVDDEDVARVAKRPAAQKSIGLLRRKDKDSSEPAPSQEEPPSLARLEPARRSDEVLQSVDVNVGAYSGCSFGSIRTVFGQGRVTAAASSFKRIASVRPAATVPAPAAQPPARDHASDAATGNLPSAGNDSSRQQQQQRPSEPPAARRPAAATHSDSDDPGDDDLPRRAPHAAAPAPRPYVPSFRATAPNLLPPLGNSLLGSTPGDPGEDPDISVAEPRRFSDGGVGIMDITAMSQRSGGAHSRFHCKSAIDLASGEGGEEQQQQERGVRDRPLKAGKAGTNFVRLNLGKKGKGGRSFLSKAGTQRKFKGKSGGGGRGGGFGGRGGGGGRWRRKAAAGLKGDTAKRQPGLVRDDMDWDEAERIAAEAAEAACGGAISGGGGAATTEAATAALYTGSYGGGGGSAAAAEEEMEEEGRASGSGAEGEAEESEREGGSDSEGEGEGEGKAAAAAAAAAERRAASRAATTTAAKPAAKPARATRRSSGGAAAAAAAAEPAAERPAPAAAAGGTKRKRGASTSSAPAPAAAAAAAAAPGSKARKAPAAAANTAAAAPGGGVSAEILEAIRDAQKDPSERNLTALLRAAFGHPGFREGQVEIITRVLRRESTLAVLPTGQGKSLCYQLPAMLLPGTTLVVSPLVALMEDQLAHLPPSLPGAALHSAQSPAAAAAALTALRGGALKILFLSPERFLSPRFRALISGLPPGAFPRMVVVDEAHCVSEWSHNFRPAYQRLGCAISALADLCCGGARPAVLAVTATATLRTEAHCADILGISRPGGVVRLGSVRNNLRLAVVRSTGDQRMPALLALLRPSAAAKKSQQLASAGVSVSRDFSSGRHDRGPLGIPRAQLGSFAQDLSKLESGSAIVYCGYRFEAERVAGYLFQNGVSAAAYHSGLKAEERAKVLRLFMAGRLRVVCATVAFGMGLDKADVRCVVNYSLPRSIEAFVQQVGRAGRDGLEALGVTFCDSTDYLRLRALSFSDSADGGTMARLVARVFPDEIAEGAGAQGPEGNSENIYLCLNVEQVSKALDVREEVLETALTYLGLVSAPETPQKPPQNSSDPPPAEDAEDIPVPSGSGPLIRILPDVRCSLSIGFYKSSPEDLAQTSDVVAAVLACGKKGRGSGRWACAVGEVVRRLGCSFTDLDARLSALSAAGEVSYELRDRGLAYQVLRVPADRRAVAKALALRFDQAEGCQVSKLDAMINAAEAALACLAPAGDGSAACAALLAPARAANTPAGPPPVLLSLSADSASSVRDQEVEIRTRADAYFRADWGSVGVSADTGTGADTATTAAAAQAEGQGGEGKGEGAVVNGRTEREVGEELFRRPSAVQTDSPFLTADIRALLRQAGSSPSEDTGARLAPPTLARILCGVASPGVSAELWSKAPFWGRYGAFDFRELVARIRAEMARGLGA